MNILTHTATFEVDAYHDKYASFHREFVRRTVRMHDFTGDCAVMKADKIINAAGVIAVILAALYFVPLSLSILMG
jgi:hypothetical protein